LWDRVIITLACFGRGLACEPLDQDRLACRSGEVSWSAALHGYVTVSSPVIYMYLTPSPDIFVPLHLTSLAITFILSRERGENSHQTFDSNALIWFIKFPSTSKAMSFWALQLEIFCDHSSAQSIYLLATSWPIQLCTYSSFNWKIQIWLQCLH
jgi:hypothetical protein